MAKRIIQKKILYLETLLTETKGFFRRTQVRFCIWNEKLKLKNDLIEIPDVFLFDIVISDRQGKRVYTSNNYLNNWNGVDSDGNVLPNGVYFYYMKNRQSKDEYRGYIQIIR